MGKLLLYGIEASPPVRTVLLTLNALALEFDFKEVNLMAGDHLTDEYRKKNPQHTVPVLEDDGKVLWDSHAIAAYLVGKYAKDDALYPKDLYQRAIVDQRLHFDSGVLFSRLRYITMPMFAKSENTISQDDIDAVNEGYNFLEAFLQQDYLTGNTLTIADLSVFSTVSSSDVLIPIDAARTPKLAAWKAMLMKLPYYEKSMAKGLEMFAKTFKSRLAAK